MPIMNTVLGGVGKGVQPKDNPVPGNAPSAAVKTLDNSLPPPQAITAQGGSPGSGDGPMPLGPSQNQPNSFASPQSAQTNEAPPPKPDQEDADVDNLINQLAGKPQTKPVQKELDKHEENLDNLLNTFAGAKSEAQNAEPGQGAATGLPEKFKFAAAQIRAHLGKNPLEQRQAFESMYGDKNVKSMGGKLMFRPDENSKFRGVDERLLGPGIDWALFNLANVPGLAAQMATQAEANVLTGPIVGNTVGAAVAGGVSSVVNHGLKNVINAFSSKPQGDETTFDGSDIAKQSAYGLAGGTLGMGLGAALSNAPRAAAWVGEKVPVLQAAADKIGNALAPGIDATLSAAGSAAEKLAQVRTAISEFKDIVFPASGKLAESDSSAVGISVGDAMDKTHETLSKQLELMKDHAVALAEQTGQKVNTSATMNAIKTEVQKYGYYLNDSGHLAPIPGASSGLSDTPVNSALQDLVGMHNNLSAQQTTQGGRNLEYFLTDLDKLAKKAKFDKISNSDSDVVNMYKAVRESAAGDRNDFLKSLYGQTDLPDSKAVTGAITKYEGNIDAIKSFNGTFDIAQKRELLIDSLSKSSTPDKNEMLDNIFQVLGPTNKNWNSLKSGIFDNILDKNTQNGVLNAPAVMKLLTNPSNKPSAYAKRLFSDDQVSTLNKMLFESQKITNESGINPSSASKLQKGMTFLISLAGKPIDFARQMFGILGNNKKAVDYMVDDGFLEMARNAEGPDMKRRIMDAMRVTDAVRQKMQIVDFPTVTQGARKAMVQKYAPVAGPALDSAMQGIMGNNSFRPGMTPNPQPQNVQAPVQGQ